MSEIWITNHIDIISDHSKAPMSYFAISTQLLWKKYPKMIFAAIQTPVPNAVILCTNATCSSSNAVKKEFSLYLPRKWLHMSECFDWSLIRFFFFLNIQLFNWSTVVGFKTSFLKPPSLFILSESKYATKALVNVATSLKTRALRRGQRGRPPSDISGRLNRSQALW